MQGVVSSAAFAQTPANLIALQGLSPLSALPGTEAGKAALAANLLVTRMIQTGSSNQSALLPFPQQQQQALRDAFITGANASELTDGFGSKLGAAYREKADYATQKDYTSVSAAMATLVAYTNAVTATDSNMAKYFFANGTKNGTAPVSVAATAILQRANGAADVFGRAYGFPAGSTGSDGFGNSRPFQTQPTLVLYDGLDYFGQPSNNTAYLRGPAQDLTDSPSFPSGHTTYGYGQSLLLGILVPDRYLQEITRGAEYGNNRLVIGAHYAMDVLAGRTLAMHDLAHLLANDPVYVGQPISRGPMVTDYRQAFMAARADLVAALQAGCGAVIAVCAIADSGRFSDPKANELFYETTQTYGLPVVHTNTANQAEDVRAVAPEAGYLLTVAFPFLTLDQADAILTSTEGPGGGFLDDGSAFGLYSRLNLYAAVKNAMALAPR